MKANAQTVLTAAAGQMIMIAAAGAYAEAKGVKFDDYREKIMDEIHANLKGALEDTKRTIHRAAEAGLLQRDPRFGGEVIAATLSAVALAAAAKVLGEPTDDPEIDKAADEAVATTVH